MQQFTRRTLTVDGLELAYAETGDGPPVVYIHGALTTLEEGMIGLAATLGARCRLIAFDRPGHGESAGDATTGSALRQAELIRGALVQLGVERPVVVGHSFGGAVAMAMALEFPDEVAGVVALAPVAFPEPRPELMMFGPRAAPLGGIWLSLVSAPADALLLPVLWNTMFLPHRMPPAFREGFPFGLAAGRSQTRADGQDATAMLASLTRSAMRYPACRVPVHILQGDRDLVVNPFVHGRPLAAVLPRGRFTSLPGHGHMAHHIVPEVVVEAVEAMFAQTEPLTRAA